MEYYTIEFSNNLKKIEYNFLNNFNFYVAHLKYLYNFNDFSFKETQELINFKIEFNNNIGNIFIENKFEKQFKLIFKFRNSYKEMNTFKFIKNNLTLSFKFMINLEIENINITFNKYYKELFINNISNKKIENINNIDFDNNDFNAKLKEEENNNLIVNKILEEKEKLNLIKNNNENENNEMIEEIEDFNLIKENEENKDNNKFIEEFINNSEKEIDCLNNENKQYIQYEEKNYDNIEKIIDSEIENSINLNKREINKYSENCTICLENIIGKIYLEECKHNFCFNCIKIWSEKSNKCPICKVKFNRINKINENNSIISYLSVENNSINITEEEELEDELSEDFCYKCNKEDDKFLMLICDNCNIKVCHIYCLKPKLEMIPNNDWYCDYCVKEFNLKSSNPTAKIFDVDMNFNDTIKIEMKKENFNQNQTKLKDKINSIKNDSSNLNTNLKNILNHKDNKIITKEVKLMENLFLIEKY